MQIELKLFVNYKTNNFFLNTIYISLKGVINSLIYNIHRLHSYKNK